MGMTDSADTRIVRCPHARPCGGCPLIDRPYDAQLERKRERVRESLARYETLASIEVLSPHAAAPIEGYRTRAKFAVGAGGTIGMYAREHAVVDVPECKVLSTTMRDALASLRARLKAPAGSRALVARADGGALRAVDLRAVRAPTSPSQERLLLTLVLERGRCDDAEARAACEALVRDGVVACAAVSWHDGASPQLLGATPEVLAGPRSMRDELDDDGLWSYAAPGSFAQAHRATAAAIRRSLRHAIEREREARAGPARVLELYAGSGALGLSLAKAGMDVTMVESFAPASSAAEDAARAQGIQRARAIAIDAARFARDEARRGERYDAVVINPPRRGVERAALDAIAALEPAVVLYVSCDPETLARDLATLRDAGYAAEEALPFDMIPLTDEVETVVVARRTSEAAPGVREVYCDERLAVLDGGAGVRVRALQWAARVPRWSEAVAIAGADGDESGLVVVARALTDARSITDEPMIESLRCEAWVKSIARDKGVIERRTRERREARTRYKRAKIAGGHSEVRLVIERGDTGSARAHLAQLGHPTLGDEQHGDRATNAFARERLGLDRTALHVRAIDLRVDGVTRTLRARDAGDLALLEARLRRRSITIT